MANQTFGTNDPTQRPDDYGTEASGRLRNVTQGLNTAAEQVRDQVREHMDSTVEYFRDHDTQKMMNDLTNYVKSHPLPAIAGAVALGFFAGRMLRRE